jgi:hypothetical protein
VVLTALSAAALSIGAAALYAGHGSFLTGTQTCVEKVSTGTRKAYAGKNSRIYFPPFFCPYRSRYVAHSAHLLPDKLLFLERSRVCTNRVLLDNRLFFLFFLVLFLLFSLLDGVSGHTCSKAADRTRCCSVF